MAVKICVMSGKGGVGKSSIACLIAKILSEKHKVLLIDTDICGPSTSHIFNTKQKLLKAEKGLVPAKITDNLDLLSMALLINENDSVIWRAPKKISLLQLFYESICHDYLVYDTPPGISEEHEFLANKIDFVFVVTTSQNIALSDSIRSIEFAQKNELRIVGLIENMSGIKCKGCNKITNIFSVSGGESLAKECNIPFLTKISYDYELLKITNNGSFIDECDNTFSYKAIREVLINNKFI